MHVRWFGESWGRGGTAPICDPDYHIEAPMVLCASCDEPIEHRDRGVATACGIEYGEWTATHLFQIESVVTPDYFEACAYHVDCWVEVFLGPTQDIAKIDRVGPRTVLLGGVVPPPDPLYPG